MELRNQVSIPYIKSLPFWWGFLFGTYNEWSMLEVDQRLETILIVQSYYQLFSYLRKSLSLLDQHWFNMQKKVHHVIIVYKLQHNFNSLYFEE